MSAVVTPASANAAVSRTIRPRSTSSTRAGGGDERLLEDEQVVVERHDGQHRAEEHHPVEATFDRRGEDVELGPETGDARDAAEREEEHQHREREQW